MHFPALPPWIGFSIFLAVCGAALWKGGRDERLVAAAFLANCVLSILDLARQMPGTQWGEFALDIAFLLFLCVVALRSARYWPIFAAAFQLLAVMTHLASTFDRHLGAWAYVTAGIIWTQLVTTSLAVGTYNRWRERRQIAIDAAAIAEPGAARL